MGNFWETHRNKSTKGQIDQLMMAIAGLAQENMTLQKQYEAIKQNLEVKNNGRSNV